MPPLSNAIHDVFEFYQQKIQSIYSENESKSILYLLIEHLFGMSRLDIWMNPEKRLSESEIIQIYDAVQQLKQNIPIQHIINSASFCDNIFYVNSDTLIPRPETEELVQIVSQHIDQPKTKILDVGTGSGAIAISLKKRHPDCIVSACDISEKALNIAKYNATLLQANITFFAYNILSKDSDIFTDIFDIIVSNPPYIPISEKKEMRANVAQHEPAIALFVPDDQPLLYYEAIVAFSIRHLSKNGLLFFEVHENYASQVQTLINQNGFGQGSIQKDLFGKDRIVWGKKR